MKKINQLSNNIYTGIVIFLIGIIGFLTVTFNQMMDPIEVKEANSNEAIVYDTSVDWTTSGTPIELKGLDQNLDYFIDGQSTGCFFAIINSFGYTVDIDKFYYDYLDGAFEVNERTELQGKFYPEMLNYKYNQYLENNNIDLQCADITNKNNQYIYDTVKQGNNVIIWYNSADYNFNALNTYIIKDFGDRVIIIDYLGNEWFIDINTFWEVFNNCGHYAIVIGKYK